jgi:class 3 adenylate cyclase
MSDLQAQDPRDAIRDYLLQAEERAVFRALPHQIAHALKQDPRRTLESLVEAMFRGDAVMHWELFCPFCHFRAEQQDWLRNARHDFTCPACSNTYDVHLDVEAQVTFSPHPMLRELSPEADDPDHQRASRERFPPTTVHELMTVQSFRDWARNEPLPSGEYLEVRHMTVWFSDLTGSTALYARNGDPLAYDLVREHFRLVFEAVNRYGGAVVKTMGDGIMATFSSSARAVEAALAAHRVLDDFNQQKSLAGDRRLALKIGIHAGPSIVVTLNDRLDYFGTTVNVAARVNDLARGTETVFTTPVQIDPQVQGVIDAAGYDIEQFRSDVKGLDQALTVFCLVKPGAGSRRRPGWKDYVKRRLGVG